MSQLSGTSPSPQPRPAAKSRFNELSSEEFMKIIFTELQQQDPLKPNDSNALLQQLNSIRSIESDVAMGDKLQSIVFQNQLASAGNLIGKNITGLNDQSQRVSGTVKSVTREGQKVSLILNNNWKVPIDNLENINATQPNTGG